jgi:hypothetical protein
MNAEKVDRFSQVLRPYGIKKPPFIYDRNISDKTSLLLYRE